MPYIITTKQPLPDTTDLMAGLEASLQQPKRRAVATLDEARVALLQACGSDQEAKQIVSATAGRARWNGDTVGPLPDGTVIEVERVSPLRLASMYGGSGAEVMAALAADDWAPLIDAFNARERAR